MLKDLTNSDKTSYYYEEAQTSFSINSAVQTKETSPVLQENMQARIKSNLQPRIELTKTSSSTSSVFGLSN